MSPVQQPLLDVRSLRVTYGGVVAVGDVDATVAEGEVFGLIGPNGAGKTSMIDALTGYHRPSAGSVLFDGADITRMRPHRRARRGLARTFQSVELFDDLTVDENLLVASERAGVAQALGTSSFRPAGRTGRRWTGRSTSATCEDVVDRYPTEISHGQRKLVGVGRALAQQPAPGPARRARRRARYRREPGARAPAARRCPTSTVSTVLLVDHDMGLVLSVCDRLMVLDFGCRSPRARRPRSVRIRRCIEAYLGSHARRGERGS